MERIFGDGTKGDIFAQFYDKEYGFLSVYKDPQIINVDMFTATDCKKGIEDMMKGWGDGSRAFVNVYWTKDGARRQAVMFS